MTNYDQFLSHAAGLMKESAIRQMGSVLSQSKDMISFAPGYPAEDQFPWIDFTDICRELLTGTDGSVLQYGPTRGFKPLRETTIDLMKAARHHQRARAGAHHDRLTTGARPGGPGPDRSRRRGPDGTAVLHGRDLGIPERRRRDGRRAPA